MSQISQQDILQGFPSWSFLQFCQVVLVEIPASVMHFPWDILKGFPLNSTNSQGCSCMSTTMCIYLLLTYFYVLATHCYTSVTCLNRLVTHLNLSDLSLSLGSSSLFIGDSSLSLSVLYQCLDGLYLSVSGPSLYLSILS